MLEKYAIMTGNFSNNVYIPIFLHTCENSESTRSFRDE
jgi:hypothetical protein